MRMTIIQIWLLFLSALTLLGQGIVLWDESVNGPISNTSGMPTGLSFLQLGTNDLYATVERTPYAGGWIVTNDFFVITVPAGLEVNKIDLSSDGPVWAWIGSDDYSQEYGSADSASAGNLLLQWGISSLTTGTYGIYISNDEPQPMPSSINYRLSFIVQTVPEPSALSLLLAGAGCVVGWRWRKKLPFTSQ